MNILNNKIIVCTTLQQNKLAKIKGDLNLKSLYLYNIVSCYLSELKCKKKNITDIRKLEDLLIKIKYSSNVSDYKIKDLKSYKNTTCCKDCDKRYGSVGADLNYSPIIPFVGNASSDLLTTTYDFKILDFTTDFNSFGEGGPEKVRIITLPSSGTILYNNSPIMARFEFNLSDIGNLKFNSQPGMPDEVSFEFQTSNSNQLKTYSNMALFTINVDALVNLPPSEVSDNLVTISHASSKIFTVADFTTNTTPPYSDPEGDAAFQLKVTSLPTNGTLKYNNINVTVSQIIPFAGIAAGDLIYEADGSNNSAYSINFNFEVSDAGSQQFTA